MKSRNALLIMLVVLSMLLSACAQATPAAAPTTAPVAQPTAAPAGGLTGEMTLWHSYHAGGSEETTLTDVVGQLMKDNPGLTVNMLEIPFDQVFNKWETEVAAGGGPDMFTVPNDNLGTEVRAGLVAPLDDLLKGKLDVFSKAGVDGMTVEGKIYGVPGIIKAVALYYNKSTVPTPPKTTDELMALVKSGKKIAINQNNYHNYGWLTGAFGGKLMDDTGKCTADAGGFADALQYMSDLKAAGANFETDGAKADTLFRQGQVDMIINGPWVLGDYKKDLGDKLGLVPMPAGPKGAATPLSGIDGWHVNPNVSPEQQQLAVEVGLYIFTKGAQAYEDVAGDPMVAKGVTAKDPLVQAFADAGSAGFPRPQSKEFGNWWGPFGDAVTKVMEGKSKPVDAVNEACAAMNKASGKTAAGGGAAAALTGEVTLWHSYHAGGSEETTLTDVVGQLMKDNPGLTVNMLEIPFDQVFNKWETEVAAGGGPDMFTVPNDNLGTEVRAGLVAPLDDLLKGKLDVFSKAGVDGMTVEGKIYGVPGIIKAVALYYNKSTVPTPPKTTDELMALVKSGKKIAINQNNYHNYGWLTGAFGGKLMDDTGKCTADAGGFADALQYMSDLKAAGANFETDGAKADTLFRQGQVDMIINGPWVLGDYKKDLGDKLGLVPMPAGPKGAATPLSGIDGWHVNPNVSPEQQQLAVEVGLYIFTKGAQAYEDVAGDPMVAKGVTAKDPLVQAFADAGSAGFPRPQSKEFGNWWGPFGDAVTKVMEGKSKPVDAVNEACAAMNKASGIK